MPASEALRFAAIGKTYRTRRAAVHALQNIDLAVAAGQVYGFLGPNGAGKTTSIRLLLDLIRPTAGEVFVFGRPVRRERDVLRRVGALVESANFYPALSARDNLRVIAGARRLNGPANIDALLAQVDLDTRADRPVSGFSLGMKQRLGLAAALLADPELVVLDEPTNGLDPAGIQHTRALIREFAERQGKTVFLSSHLLSEVEQVCDRVAIIHRGTIVREGPVRELLQSGEQLRVQATPLEQAASILRASRPVTLDGDWLVVEAAPADSPALVAQLVGAGVQVFQVVAQRQTLEAYFLKVTQEQASDA